MAAKKAAKLPAKQAKFIAEYLANGFNAAEAARQAGYSKKTAESQASRLLRNVKVASAIRAKTSKSLAAREITAERVLDELAKLAFLDPRKLFSVTGQLVPVHLLSDAEAASIAGMELVELTAEKCPIGTLKKIKFVDKGQNLERLGRYLKLFTDRVEHTVKIQRVLLDKKITRLKPSQPEKPEFEK